jgi:hypothetical protein
MNVRVSELVRDEVAGIARWHNIQPARLGSDFLDAFEKALNDIEAAPYLHGVADDGRIGHEDREFFMPRFKQRVIYNIAGDVVRVIAIVHSSRKPGIWHLQANHEERR